VIVGAGEERRRPLFFALLVITVSFIPVFLAYCAGGPAVSATRVSPKHSRCFLHRSWRERSCRCSCVLLIRGKIVPEKDNPINRFLIRTYQPLVNFVLRYRWFTLGLRARYSRAHDFPFSRLGSEFMPRSMRARCSTCRPRFRDVRSPRRRKILQIQDRQLKKIPEAMTVFGKAGQPIRLPIPAAVVDVRDGRRAEATNEWRKGMTWDKLLAEINANIKTPGMASILWMPIQTRTEMLTTGFRSVLGIKVFGPDLSGIQKSPCRSKKELVQLPNTRSAFAESGTVGGYFLDFTVNRERRALRPKLNHSFFDLHGDLLDAVRSGPKTFNTSTLRKAGSQHFGARLDRHPKDARHAWRFDVWR